MNFSKIDEITNELHSIDNAVCIVEGIRDKAALEKLGFTNVFDISGKSLYEVANRVSRGYSTAVILSDLDEEGEIVADYLRKNLQAKGMRVDLQLRQKIRKLFGVKRIEELGPYAKLKTMHESGFQVDKLIRKRNYFRQQKAEVKRKMSHE